MYGWAGWIAKYILYFALRAALRASKIAPGDFVEPVVLIQRLSHPRDFTLDFALYGWAGWIRTNECQDQNLVPYHLATAQ